ncbi:transporter substrate-binding domain-containing protein [Castellaniella sp.]|uniref:transporter substrate-binding domain-containing protein n=1 Tax=Castellaniella sp. TaxID=1955812 RepID=UPI0025C20CEF|nr:transporter substrate-binding domain-containing protein [Castellaniella sp.]
MRIGIARVPPAPAPGAKVRTPVQLEALLIRATGGVQPQSVVAEQAVGRIHQGTLDVWVGALSPHAALPEGVQRVALAWSASPMAIMRSDTAIRRWEDLKDHTVCLAADGRYRGELAARYDAIERIYPSATDALLALRTGQCDATVQDESLLRELLKFPEWHKFSAVLEPYRHQDLVRLTRRDLPTEQRALLSRQTGPATLQAAASKQARDIAFEVYLDQAVPDCH